MSDYRKWISSKWSQWKYAVPVVFNLGLSVTCYFVGWHMSSKSSAMPFARSGAAATTIAIGFTLYDYRQAIQNSVQSASQTVTRATSGLHLTGAESRRRIIEKIKRKSSITDLSITAIQALILMAATVVWGFGDLATGWFSE